MFKNRVGRPTKEIDWNQVNKLCEIHCTAQEVASFLDMSVDTLDRRVREVHNMKFADYFALKAANGKISLRRSLYLKAMSNGNGSVAMAIWLSKNWLGMKERSDEEKYRDMRPIIIETSQGIIKLGMAGKDGKLHNDESTEGDHDNGEADDPGN